MTRFYVALVLILALILLSSPTTAQFIRSLRTSGDAQSTYEIGIGNAFGLPRLTSISALTTPGAIALILPTDGSNQCEGRIAVKVSSGIRCVVTESP